MRVQKMFLESEPNKSGSNVLKEFNTVIENDLEDELSTARRKRKS